MPRSVWWRALVVECLVLFVSMLLSSQVSGTIVTEVVAGSIFRLQNFLTVDHYTLQLTASSTVVEFDILSVETSDNLVFRDVNNDCDSAFIDSHIHLFRRNPSDQSLVLVASNDDEGDDNSGYFTKGRKDGSLNTQDSYLIRQLAPGEYILAVGRYPLSVESARAGKSMESVTDFSPYACQLHRASYGNYQLTIRWQTSTTTTTTTPSSSSSSSSQKILTKSPNSYVGNSCLTTNSTHLPQCLYAAPPSTTSTPTDALAAIRALCPYDVTVL